MTLPQISTDGKRGSILTTQRNSHPINTETSTPPMPPYIDMAGPDSNLSQHNIPQCPQRYHTPAPTSNPKANMPRVEPTLPRLGLLHLGQCHQHTPSKLGFGGRISDD